jgi:6-phosphogluconolactonase
VDREGRNVLVANYGGGTVSVLPVDEDGRLANASEVVQHKDADAETARARTPHAHCINLDAAGRFAFVADLGLDKVFVYRFDPAKGKLTPNDPPAVSVAEKSGPRHFAFHPNGRFAYVINETASTVTAFTCDAGRGVLAERQAISTLPDGFTGKSDTAEVQVHPSGKFLYGSNRGHDSIVVFALDAQTGRLTLVEHQPTQGRTPRNFAIDPTGAYLLAANQRSDSVVVFRVDPRTGRLTPTGTKAEVPSPVCLTFLPAAPPR